MIFPIFPKTKTLLAGPARIAQKLHNKRQKKNNASQRKGDHFTAARAENRLYARRCEHHLNSRKKQPKHPHIPPWTTHCMIHPAKTDSLTAIDTVAQIAFSRKSWARSIFPKILVCFSFQSIYAGEPACSKKGFLPSFWHPLSASA